MFNQEIKTVITRQKNYKDKNLWITTNSFKSGENWYNCLYIHFNLKNFPKLKQIPNQNYSEAWPSQVECHKGVTFYEETILPPCIYGREFNEVMVKFGCDYSHYMDECYMEADHGELILRNDADYFVGCFLELYSRIEG